MPALQIDYRPIESLTAYARNARTHSDEHVAQIAASIPEFGFNNPVLVDGQRGVIAGHARILAARKLAMTEVPVIELAHLTDTQRRAFILAENKLAERAGWDAELLALELEDLKLAEFDLALTGFDAGEIEALLTDEVTGTDGEQGDGDPSDAADDVPEILANPVSRPGDVWALGQHRLICGDAADAGVVTTLMAGEQAHLLFTSPPYANQRAYTTSPTGID
jgi:ParB-like chromosome segregation protein Spo0J